jgi:riboflavin kinase/FMN adenylyltransferase
MAELETGGRTPVNAFLPGTIRSARTAPWQEALATVTGQVVRGFVVPGDQRGRRIGFPTANLALEPHDTRVRDGVYAGTFTIEGIVEHPAAVSIGRRSTIYENGVRLLEAHLIEFTGDLYEKYAAVRLVEFIRPQHRFDDIASLSRQLHKDVATARTILGLQIPPSPGPTV